MAVRSTMARCGCSDRHRVTVGRNNPAQTQPRVVCPSRGSHHGRQSQSTRRSADPISSSWKGSRGATPPCARDSSAVTAAADRSMLVDPRRPRGVVLQGGGGAEPAPVARRGERRCRSPAGEQRHSAGVFAADAAGREPQRSGALRGAARRAPPGAGARPQALGVPLRMGRARCGAREGHDARRSPHLRHRPRWARACGLQEPAGSARDSARCGSGRGEAGSRLAARWLCGGAARPRSPHRSARATRWCPPSFATHDTGRAAPSPASADCFHTAPTSPPRKARAAPWERTGSKTAAGCRRRAAAACGHSGSSMDPPPAADR